MFGHFRNGIRKLPRCSQHLKNKIRLRQIDNLCIFTAICKFLKGKAANADNFQKMALDLKPKQSLNLEKFLELEAKIEALLVNKMQERFLMEEHLTKANFFRLLNLMVKCLI